MASGIFDELFLEFGLKTQDFEEGVKRTGDGLRRVTSEHDKFAKEVDAKTRAMTEFFSGLRNQVLLLAGALTGGVGLKEFVAGTTRAEASTARMADNLRMGREQLSLWKEAAKYAGGTAAGVESAFRGLATSIEQFKLTGERNAVVGALYQMRIPYEDEKGNMRDVSEIFKDISDRIHAHDEKALALAQLMGWGDETLNFARLGGAGEQALVNRQRSIFHYTDEDQAAGIKLQNAINELGDVSKNTGTKILTELTPALTKLLGVIEDGVRWSKTEKDWSRARFGLVHDMSEAEAARRYGGAGAFGDRVPDNMTTHSPHWSASQLFRHRMQVLNDELSAATSEEDRAAIMREMAGAQRGYAGELLWHAKSAASPSAASTTNNSSLSVGTMNINTQATSATGIAQDIHGELSAAARQANGANN